VLYFSSYYFSVDSGYDKCYASGKIIEVACFAHARRKFVDALKVVADDVVANQAIETITKLYAIEKKAKNMSNTQRYYYRKHYAHTR